MDKLIQKAIEDYSALAAEIIEINIAIDGQPTIEKSGKILIKTVVILAAVTAASM